MEIFGIICLVVIIIYMGFGLFMAYLMADAGGETTPTISEALKFAIKWPMMFFGPN